MAIESKNIAIGGAVLSLGAYVTAGGAGSLTDVGALKDGSEIAINREVYEIMSDSAQGPLRAVPVGMAIEIKAILQETKLNQLATLLGTDAATGTPPNYTDLIGAAAEAYLQGTISTKGVAHTNGTYATRLWTFWKLYVKSLGAIPVKKGAEQVFEVTFGAIYDTSLATNDKFGKVADSGAA